MQTGRQKLALTDLDLYRDRELYPLAGPPLGPLPGLLLCLSPTQALEPIKELRSVLSILFRHIRHHDDSKKRAGNEAAGLRAGRKKRPRRARPRNEL